MNFLAHQVLSFNNVDLQIGNLYGESVKAKDYLKFPEGIQKGILLHRHIDSYTDSHPAVKRSTSLFHENYSKYSPVIVDVLYDYFLIQNWDAFNETPLDQFIEDCYALFRDKFDTFNSDLQFIVHHLLEYDWFNNYRSVEGIKETLRGISGRSTFVNNIADATNEMIEFNDELNEDFLVFFPQIIASCKNFIKNE